jgi:ribonuclease D
MSLITQTDALAALCRRLEGSAAIAVDTEFMRERTYWPKLCLVQVAGQVAGSDEAAAIDPLADGIDLAPLFALLADRRTIKVFHAGRQDLEIFFRAMGEVPAPLFDTQLAAMVCGYGEQVAYETLASKLARAKLDKGSRFTDWSLRPLSERQIEYALGDVVHLLVIYRKLDARLVRTGRAGWLEEDLAALADPASYSVAPETAYRRIKTRSHQPPFLSVLRELAAWREREAQARDIPRPWLLRDEALVEIAHHTPRAASQLVRTRGLSRKLAEGETGEAILAAVARGLERVDSDPPEVEARRDIPRGAAPVADLLKVLLKIKCEQAEVAQRLVASADDVETIAALGADAPVRALAGWRRKVFGEDALKVRDGRLALAIEARKIALVEHAPCARR